MSEECKQFNEGSRKWDICTGKADLPIDKINLYRVFWGLSPLSVVSGASQVAHVIHDGKPLKHITNKKKIASSKAGCACAVRKPIILSGPGTELIEIFKNSGVPSCQQCKNLAKKMDEWGVNKCRENIDEIVNDIMPRAIKWFEENKPWMNKLIPDGSLKTASIRIGVTYNVNKAIDRADAKAKKSINWSSSIQSIKAEKLKTVNSFDPIFRIKTAIRTSFRENPTLGATVLSIKNAGFEDPIIFADNDSPEINGCIRWPEQFGPFKSFVNMSERLISDYDGWLLICEDDVELKIGLADFIREANLGKNQIITFYMSDKQEKILPSYTGFNVVSGDIWGSLAYFIHSDALKQMLDSQNFINWDSERRVDRVFCKAVSELGFELLHHKPSLAQHVGETSTLSRIKMLDSNRTSGTYSAERHNNDLITLITPTGDRQKSFELCERWIKNQRYTGNIQWIVIDDGVVPTNINYTTDTIKLDPINTHSLCRNIQAAIPYIKGNHILIIEDDDYYGPDYISTMVGRLKHADLVGEVGGKYYYLNDNKYRLSTYDSHVSLCRTGFNPAVLNTLIKVIMNTDHPSIDERIWAEWSGSKYVWRDDFNNSRMCVSIKGGSGRQSHSYRTPNNTTNDSSMRVLEKWISDDVKYYK